MAISAECPECGATASVPNSMSGRKVRCTSCDAVFLVDEPVKKKKSASRPGSKSILSESGGVSRRGKDSGKGMRVALAVTAIVLLVGGAGVGLFFALQETTPTVKVTKSGFHSDAEFDKLMKSAAKGKMSQADIDRLAKATKSNLENAARGMKGKIPSDAELEKAFGAADKKTSTTQTAKSKDAIKTPPVDQHKKQGPPQIKNFEPVVVASLAGSSPLEVSDLSSVRAIVPIANQPGRIGLHTIEGKAHFFEMYDLKKQERLAKVKLDDDVALVDVDPDGTVLATTTREKSHVFVYSLPDGGLIEDDWRPYDNIRDEARFLSSGKVEQISMLSKSHVLTMTSHGFGDVWELKSHNLVYPIPKPDRREYRKGDVVHAGRDFVLGPDRSLLAFATDDGIQIIEAKTGKKLGTTTKPSKFGKDIEIAGMGFDPAGKTLAVYFSASKPKGREFYHGRFNVPAGDEVFVEAAADPGDFGGVEFVNGDVFFAFKGREAWLRDARGKTMATGRVPSGVFSPKVVQSNVAFTFLDAKSKPAIGFAAVPLGGPEAKAPDAKGEAKAEPKMEDKEKEKEKAEPKPMPDPMPKSGGGLGDLFAPDPATAPLNPPPAAKTLPGSTPVKTKTIEQEEIWEFGPQGILKKGVKSFEK